MAGTLLGTRVCVCGKPADFARINNNNNNNDDNNNSNNSQA